MKFVKIAALGMAVLAIAACSTVDNLTAVSERRETPKNAAILIAQDVTPALQDLALLCEVGILEDDTKAQIAKHGPRIVSVAEAYFESAEYCMVVDGTLQSEGFGNCNRGSIQEFSRALPTELARIGSEFGLDTDVGKSLFLASVVARRITAEGSAGTVTGFSTDDQLTRQQYVDALEPLRAAKDAVAMCVTQVEASE